VNDVQLTVGDCQGRLESLVHSLIDAVDVAFGLIPLTNSVVLAVQPAPSSRQQSSVTCVMVSVSPAV